MLFEIRKAKDESYYYVLLGGNGQVMLTSEMMTQKHSCMESIESIKKSLSESVIIKDVT